MKVVLIMFRDDERRDFPLTAKSTILGRRPDCGLRIPTRDVSRQHCQIDVGDAQVTVKDLGSSNGTYVNGKRIAEIKLGAGDRLQVGPVLFIVQVNGKPANVLPADLAPVEAKAPVAAKPSAPGSPPAAKAAPVGKKPADKPPAAKSIDEIDESDLFELDDTDFDLDDAVGGLGGLDDDDDDEPKKTPPRKK